MRQRSDNLRYQEKDGPLPNSFSRKLAGLAQLSEGDLSLLSIASTPERWVASQTDLIVEGDKPGPTFVVLDGWACRYKVLPDGTRQIMAFLMPGDFCDLHVGLLDEMDHSLGTLTACRVAAIGRDAMEQLLTASPALTRAFWRAQLVDEAVMRAWIVSIGRRDSRERVAHLMMELYCRMRAIGLATEDGCRMPLTQTVLADALGLTPVHLNRVLRQLRTDGVMTFTGGVLVIEKLSELVRIAGFDANYLHRRVAGGLVPFSNGARAPWPAGLA